MLWEENVDCLEQNKTYVLSNLRGKETKRGRYSESQKFEFKETTPFEGQLAEVDNIQNLTTTTLIAKIKHRSCKAWEYHRNLQKLQADPKNELL